MHVPEGAIHRGEADVRDGVELVQLPHQRFADLAAGHLPVAALLELPLELVLLDVDDFKLDADPNLPLGAVPNRAKGRK